MNRGNSTWVIFLSSLAMIFAIPGLALGVMRLCDIGPEWMSYFALSLACTGLAFSITAMILSKVS